MQNPASHENVSSAMWDFAMLYVEYIKSDFGNSRPSSVVIGSNTRVLKEVLMVFID